ncbi:MAG TPA: DnaJ C-terminal domain-containing protein [Paraburkholderia sp.]|uniref:DnaJ C-terminal domain-containing protein n=1 Tax=Paraburkholderia sp. TaxID=1926495 RepID=UPI002BD38B35|nr:DnaJ C-terminal domain-containing protein [Paraburkholderia sp.]HTR07369.1 DnaJ C-terminal domain-containing protein [Paraburkholderia sp.]
MSFEEYYKRLKLPGTASPAEIKRAYRRLRAKYHPDRNKGREAAVEPVFKLIQEAFEILTGKRAAPSANPAAPANKSPSEEPSPRERRTSFPLRGANCLVELFVPLELAINGGGVEAHYPVKGPCHACQQEGGAVHCETCLGSGVRTWRKSQIVEIPCGAWDGQRLAVPGGGHPGVNGGPPGDAIFSVSIVCGSAFTRNGLDLACELPVDFVTAMLGGNVEANVLGRTLEVKIPANANSGTPIRLPGLGLSDRNGARGNLTLQLVLTMPAAAAHLTSAERQQLREIFADAQRRSRLSPSANVQGGKR